MRWVERDPDASKLWWRLRDFKFGLDAVVPPCKWEDVYRGEIRSLDDIISALGF